MRALALIALTVVGCRSRAPGGGDGGAWWQPRAGLSWDWQLETPIDPAAVVDVYDIDMFDNDASVMAQLHQSGRKVICYLDIGSWESYRPDASRFPASLLGSVYSGFADEKWLDIRQIELLSPIMIARFDLAKSEGCDAIEPDNMDGYDTSAHESTGFPLTAADQLAYNRWAAMQVHARGMGVGLKNDGAQVGDLVGNVDFAVSEQAFEYMEAPRFVPFIDANKPVFETEYNLALSAFCPMANQMNFSSIKKNQKLDAYREACR
jgi:hypothetical protein